MIIKKSHTYDYVRHVLTKSLLTCINLLLCDDLCTFVCRRTFLTDGFLLVLTIQGHQNPVRNGPDTASLAGGLMAVIIAVAVTGVAILVMKRYLYFDFTICRFRCVSNIYLFRQFWKHITFHYICLCLLLGNVKTNAMFAIAFFLEVLYYGPCDLFAACLTKNGLNFNHLHNDS